MKGLQRGTSHRVCRRCGRHALRIRDRSCVNCGFGATPKRTDKRL